MFVYILDFAFLTTTVRIERVLKNNYNGLAMVVKIKVDSLNHTERYVFPQEGIEDAPP